MRHHGGDQRWGVFRAARPVRSDRGRLMTAAPPGGPHAGAEGGPAAVGSAHLDAMLDALERLDGRGPEFAGFLANHGPVAADALSRLGAPDRVAAWVDAYLPRLVGAPATGDRPVADEWRDHLGDLRRLGDCTSSAPSATRVGARSWPSGGPASSRVQRRARRTV